MNCKIKKTNDNKIIYYNIEKISYNDFIKLTHYCCQFYKNYINESNVNFEGILTAARGGLVYTQYFMYFLNLKLPIYIVNFDKDKIIPSFELKNENYLFLDDINDTSKTYFKIKNNYLDANIFYLPLLERYNSKYKSICPNILDNDKYVKFPWDLEN